jgi:predicted DNA-binding transcriptional regulator AlpA
MSIRSCGLGDEAGAIASRNDDDDAIDVRLVALILGISVPTVWRQVESGDLPLPFYSSSRTPRWTRKEIREVRDSRRMLPREAMAARRGTPPRARGCWAAASYIWGGRGGAAGL